MSRIDHALHWLTENFSIADRQDFQRHFHPGGDMLLDACLSGGYCRTRGDEVVLTPMGHRRSKATAPLPAE